MNSELLYLLALTYVPEIGPANQRKILNVIEPEQLWKSSKKELKEIFKKRWDLIESFQSSEYLELAEKEMEYCQKNDIEIISTDSDNYPENLKNCADSPIVFFKKGNYNFEKKLHVGVVGTRKMTSYGKEFIGKFIDNLTGQDIAVVSGLAFGCDIEAHRKCNKNGIPNVAVLAEGLDRISPSSHAKEARKIIKNGALMSEYSTFHTTEAYNFVLRNRIIAGLCDAVVVIESDKRGGALATANYANSYNREVFAVPGRVNDRFSLGCNNLIQTNQAYMIRDADDLLNYFNLKSKPRPVQKQLLINLSPEEQSVFDFLNKNGNLHIDQLSAQLGIPLFKLNSVLLEMELKGAVKVYTGKIYGTG